MTDTGIRLLTGGDLELAEPLDIAIEASIPRALFVVLALYAGQWLTRDYLADLLWTDADQSSARKRLRMALFNLRQGIGKPLGDQLKSTKEMLSLDVPRERVDVLKFMDLCSNSDRTSRDAAIKLYRGDFLARFPPISDNFDALLSARREELKTQAVALVHQSLLDHAAADEMQSFENTLGKALQIDRTNRNTFEVAMRYFARAGMDDRIEALFQQYEKAMEEDLDLPPSEAVRNLSRELIEEARSVRLSLPPVEETPAIPPRAEATNAVSPGFPKRRRLAMFAWLGAAVAMLAVSVVWAFFSRYGKSTENSGTVFFVQAYGMQSDNCGIENVSDRYDRLVLAALRRIDGANIVLGQQGKFIVPASSKAFLLDQVVICSNDTLRTTLILTGSKGGDIKWIGRYDIPSSQLDKLADRIFADIKSGLAP